MTHLTELNPPPNTDQQATVTDRRRPGRLQDIRPELIPLLRGQETEAPSAIEFDEPDECAAARGLCTGVVLSAPLWLGIAYVGSLLLR